MVMAALLLILIPLTAHGAAEATVVPLDKLVPVHKEQTWDELIAPQLAERDRQIMEKKQKEEAAQQAAQAEAIVVSAPVPQPATQSEAYYKAWIYNEESGNNPARWNTSGCLGLGQACPASKLLVVCPNQDYACEDNWFTGYMQSRYGSWYNAYEFHLANNWW